jgi:hypothetical protein
MAAVKDWKGISALADKKIEEKKEEELAAAAKAVEEQAKDGNDVVKEKKYAEDMSIEELQNLIEGRELARKVELLKESKKFFDNGCEGGLFCDNFKILKRPEEDAGSTAAARKQMAAAEKQLEIMRAQFAEFNLKVKYLELWRDKYKRQFEIFFLENWGVDNGAMRKRGGVDYLVDFWDDTVLRIEGWEQLDALRWNPDTMKIEFDDEEE